MVIKWTCMIFLKWQLPLLSTRENSKRKWENDLGERIPHTWPSSHENFRQSIRGSVSYYVVILRTPPYWSTRVASCSFKLGDHAQQAIWRADLVLLSPMSHRQKISTWKNLARVAAEEQNGPGLWAFAGESGPDLTKIAYWGLRYISMKTTNNLLY